MTYIGRVEGCDTVVVSIKGKGCVRASKTPLIVNFTNANLICLMASSSGRTQSCHLGEPYDMHPRMILDTFSPEFPRRTANRQLSGKSSRSKILVEISAPYCILGAMIVRRLSQFRDCQ